MYADIGAGGGAGPSSAAAPAPLLEPMPYGGFPMQAQLSVEYGGFGLPLLENGEYAMPAGVPIPPPPPPQLPDLPVSAVAGAPVPDADITRLESFATWDDISFFLALHVKHQHVHVPLVHRPSFAQDVLHRRDEGDEAFRGLILSMIGYTITQCPLSWLVGRMDKARLEGLLAKCQRGSRLIQIRYQTRPSLVVLASTILDWITAQAAPTPELGANLLADVRRLVYSLGLNHELPSESLSPLDIEHCRRLYWQAYAIDKTNSLNGHPVQLADYDGAPPLPLEIDDEYLPALAQPADKTSYLAAFGICARLFKVLGGCIQRHRVWLHDADAGPSGVRLASWVAEQRRDVDALLSTLPPSLQPRFQQQGDTAFATQSANIYITALCAELALLDLRAEVVPGPDDKKERYEIARRTFAQLEHIPVECVASNGESLRGKVLRVVVSLLSADAEQTPRGLWDWWGMYSRVEFVQLLPAGGGG
ncbi:uncharacterized protein LOC62_01G000164 [Vanrija pseudolonga]|uniref:Xylanolytic transcriptional activator regulatory domain-containing protein n=1 Tax=Vanrija pseudolonga TaxID=143232 RepID=A0AAF0XZ86_9TREE|nr:hypothetical protein LOC62_01G000164 [Vanrija pseudolonga]